MTIASSIEQEQKHYSIEEYLALEQQSAQKHEYRDGEIIKITGGTTNHNTLAINFVFAFLSIFSNQDYQIYMGDVRLWIEEYRRYTYPDIMVVKDKPIYQGKGATTIKNPYLIVEVLSKSTANYDQSDKFDAYRSLPDFQEYILIDQYRYYVKQFAKNEAGKWVLTDYLGKDAVLKLESLDLEISLENLYQRVDFNVPSEE